MIYYVIFRSKAEPFTPSLRLFSLLSAFGFNDVYGCCCCCCHWCTLDVTQCLRYSFIWHLVDINVKHIHSIRFRHPVFFFSSYYYRITFLSTIFTFLFHSNIHRKIAFSSDLSFIQIQTNLRFDAHTHTRTIVFIILFARQLQFEANPHCLQTLQRISAWEH